MSKKRHKQPGDWQEAQRRCGLSAEEVKMAKELGLQPRSLIKNILSKSQPWKAPVRVWIRELHARRFGTGRGSNAAEHAPSSDSQANQPWPVDLVAQWDTVNEEPYFVRTGDGRVFTLEEAGGHRGARDSQEHMPS